MYPYVQHGDVVIGDAFNTCMSDTFSSVVVCCCFCGVGSFCFFSMWCWSSAGVGDSLRLALMVTCGGNCSSGVDTFVSSV